MDIKGYATASIQMSPISERMILMRLVTSFRTLAQTNLQMYLANFLTGSAYFKSKATSRIKVQQVITPPESPSVIRHVPL